MHPLIAFILVLTLGCASEPKPATDSGDALGICPEDHSQVECCDFETGTVTTCCCYQEDCESVQDFSRTDDGGCTEVMG